MSQRDPYDDPAFRRYAKRVKQELIPKMQDSKVVMSLLPEGEVDVKFAVELGISIMLDKPIIALVVPGVKVPDKLVRIADAIVEADLSSEEGRERTAAAIKAAMERIDAARE